jgi:hypothetical protein
VTMTRRWIGLVGLAASLGGCAIPFGEPQSPGGESRSPSARESRERYLQEQEYLERQRQFWPSIPSER